MPDYTGIYVLITILYSTSMYVTPRIFNLNRAISSLSSAIGLVSMMMSLVG